VWELVFLLLPVAAYSGWVAGKRHLRAQHKLPLSRDYYRGLNYLLNEQPDKAMDAFTKMLDVSPDSVETTLALGSLFRRKGEVERAIGIHQGLIDRPNLTLDQRGLSLLELGQDYLCAGVYDRAESLFYELSRLGGEPGEKSQKHLLHIFEREKDWDKAIQTAKSYQASSMEFMGPQIAQYYCEKAVLAYAQKDVKNALKFLKNALYHDHACVRASILQGEFDLDHGRYRSALKAFKRVEQQDITFMPEVMGRIVHIHEILGLQGALEQYFAHLLRTRPCVTTILAYAKHIEKKFNAEEAAQFMSEYLKQYPSIRGIADLIQFHLKRLSGHAREELGLLQTLFDKILTQKPIYQCQQCGFSLKALHWQCPSCQQWSKVKSIQGVEGE
jgi:lipopolysaccharide biosynthesis regulator YciM